MQKALVVVFALALLDSASAQQYVGAEAALRAMTPKGAQKTRPADPLAGLRQAIRSYRLNSARMSPQQSAIAWLALSDRCQPASAVWSLSDGSLESSLFPDVIAVLPAPSVWPEIATQLTRRLSSPKASPRDRATLAMFDTLLGNRADARKNLAALSQPNVEQLAIQAYVGVDLAMLDGNPGEIVTAYHRLAVALSRRTQPIGGNKSIELPDLTPVLGSEHMRGLFQDLLHTFDGELVVTGGAEFKKMVRDEVMKTVGSIRHPQWWLSIDPAGGPLFEALTKRFPDASGGIRESPDWNSDSYSAAASRYVTYLVANGRTEEAVKFFNSQDNWSWFTDRALDDETELLKKNGKVEAYIGFLEQMIVGKSRTHPVGAYVSFCESVGQKERAQAFLDGLPPSISDAARNRVYEKATALIEANRVAEAGDYLAGLVRSQMTGNSTESAYPNVASILVGVGRYLHRKELVDLGIEAGIRALRKSDDGFTFTWVCDEMAKEGRAVEAERLLAEVLQSRLHQPGQSSQPAGGEELEELARLYSSAKRHQDVLTLFQEAPNWGAADLAFVDENAEGPTSMTFVAAQALTAVGRRKEALHVLRHLIQVQPGFDGAYALLVDTDREFAQRFLEQRHRQRPMDSRPLMWEAEVLRREAKLDQAERLARKAISLDPQDTAAMDQATRFQAWAILAAILSQQGKPEEAARCRQKFDSPAKLYWNQSRYSQVVVDRVADLRRSLEDNPDDFVCRFQLADALVERGKRGDGEAEASEACRRAILQLGPVGEVSPSDLTDQCRKVLEEERAKDPGRASTYVLLGRIHAAGSDYAHAKADYIQAVRIDPDCLTGWNGLDEVGKHLALEGDLENRVALNLARLDPTAFQQARGAARDFAGIWLAANTLLSDSAPVEEPIFFLPASASTMEAEDDVNVENSHLWRRPPSPGTVVANQRVIFNLVRLIGTLPVAGGKKR